MIIARLKWRAHNDYRRKKGLPKISYEEWLRYRAARAQEGSSLETIEEREFRYQRLKQRLKAEPQWSETRADKLGILTPSQVRANTMENDSVQQHLLDKMVRQEGVSHFFMGNRLGWHSIGEGCFRKGRGVKG